jgi:uncharacterized protein YndB with AHSA1/START domain
VATNETTIDATPEQVFDVLMDAQAYPDWVVGAKEVRAVDPSWPEPGSEFHHKVGVGPVEIEDSTTMVAHERPSFVKLEVHAGPVGSGIVEMRLSPSDDGGTLVEMVEYPIEGPAETLDGPVEDVAIKARNLEALRRLKNLVEDRARS